MNNQKWVIKEKAYYLKCIKDCHNVLTDMYNSMDNHTTFTDNKKTKELHKQLVEKYKTYNSNFNKLKHDLLDPIYVIDSTFIDLNKLNNIKFTTSEARMRWAVITRTLLDLIDDINQSLSDESINFVYQFHIESNFGYMEAQLRVYIHILSEQFLKLENQVSKGIDQ